MMSVRAEFEKKLKDTEASVDKRMAWVLLFLYHWTNLKQP